MLYPYDGERRVRHQEVPGDVRRVGRGNRAIFPPRVDAARYGGITDGGVRRTAASVTAGAAAAMSGATPGRRGNGKREAAGCDDHGGGYGAALNTARRSG